MIELKHISKTFPTADGVFQALDDINLTIRDGDIFGIVGMSGAGKSTLVRCINLLERPTAGQVVIDGQDLMELSAPQLREKRRSISMIFQQFNLLMQRTARQNVCFPLELIGMDKVQARKRAEELLDLVGLANRMDSYPSQLSGGQKQRVAIARALATNPQVLLCDEATSALDPATTDSILSLIKDINRDLGITAVIITHEMAVVREICDSVTLLGHGQVLQTGPLEEVVADPSTPLARELVPMPVVESVPTSAATSLDGLTKSTVLLDVVFTSHPGVPTGATVLHLASSMGADVTAGTFESLGSVQVGRLALAVPAYHADKIIEQLRKNNVHAEVRTQ